MQRHVRTVMAGSANESLDVSMSRIHVVGQRAYRVQIGKNAQAAKGIDVGYSCVGSQVRSGRKTKPGVSVADDEIVRAQIPEAHYTLFNATREGLPEVIVVNDAMLTFQHPAVFPWHLRIRLEVGEIAENGMPTPEESRLLFRVGDQLEDLVLSGRTNHGARNGLFLARSTWNELRELTFQVHDPQIVDAALKGLIAQGASERPWEYRMTHDPTWQEAGYVFRLYPMANGANS
jgi:hypothetical protein